MSTSANLAAAWADRYDAAIATLQQVECAPALFQPEYVEQLRDEARAANRWARFWTARHREAGGIR